MKKILDHCPQKGVPIKDFIEDIIRDDRKRNLLTTSQIDNLGDGNVRLEDQWARLKEQNIEVLAVGDTYYPNRMITALNNKAPVLIFAKGDIGLPTKPCLGFCGSRKASKKGLKTAWDCADQMARPLFAPVYEGMPPTASGNRILLSQGASGLKKSVKTMRANLTPIEDILFHGEEKSVPYVTSLLSEEPQLALLEDKASYRNVKNDIEER